MINEEVSQQEFEFVCHHCGRIIIPGEKMLTICASLETPNWDGEIEHIESSVVSSVCFHCASDLINEMKFLISESTDAIGKATLKAHCSEQGVVFDLHCTDGVAWAVSPLFTWGQIAQLLIAADPNMFGALNEPLHQVFPKNLRLLGYCVPDWRENSGDIHEAA